MIGVDVLKFEALEQEVKHWKDQVFKLEELNSQLVDDSIFLNCLRNAGVDNWNGYDFAIEAYNEEMGIEE